MKQAWASQVLATDPGDVPSLFRRAAFDAKHQFGHRGATRRRTESRQRGPTSHSASAPLRCPVIPDEIVKWGPLLGSSRPLEVVVGLVPRGSGGVESVGRQRVGEQP